MSRDYIGALIRESDDVEQSGVKGMKWGVRKDNGTPSNRGPVRRAATKANVALNAGAAGIQKGEKKLIFLPQKNRQDAASKTQMRILGVAAEINRSPEFKGKDIKNNPDLKKKYYDEVSKNVKNIYEEELNVARVQAFKDLIETVNRNEEIAVRARKDRLQHDGLDDDDDYEILMVLKFDTDDNGLITGANQLEHSGVKGMKWGVRKDRKPAEVEVNTQTGEARTVGGSRRQRKKLAADVERDPESYGLKRKPETSSETYNRLLDQAKKQGANSLNDDELMFVTKRGNAINQVNRLNEKKPGWIQTAARNAVQQQANRKIQSLSNDLSDKYIDTSKLTK